MKPLAVWKQVEVQVSMGTSERWKKKIHQNGHVTIATTGTRHCDARYYCVLKIHKTKFKQTNAMSMQQLAGNLVICKLSVKDLECVVFFGYN